MTTDLFSGNLIILYFIFVISVITIDRFSDKQKIAIIYVCTYGIMWDENISKRLLVVLLVAMIFLDLEYFTQDEMKLIILKKLHYKLVDFLYMGIFQYKLWAVLSAIVIRTNVIKNMAPNFPWMFDIISSIVFFIALHWMFCIPEEFHTFTEMYNKIWKYPYYRLVQDENLENGISEEFQKRLDIIVQFEDRLYWKRKKAYTILSLEYFIAWYKDRNTFKEQKLRKHLTLWGHIKNILSFPLRVFNFVFMTFGKAIKAIRRIYTAFRRGHSTIPMQLIRILGYKHGLVFGNSKIDFKYYKIVKRKLYEVLYARMFFEGVKQYITIELCSGVKYYREYIVFLYPHIVQTTIDKAYVPASKYFKLSDNAIPKMSEWDINKVIDMSFGFCGKPVTNERILKWADTLMPYHYSRLKELTRDHTASTNIKKKQKHKKK